MRIGVVMAILVWNVALRRIPEREQRRSGRSSTRAAQIEAARGGEGRRAYARTNREESSTRWT